MSKAQPAGGFVTAGSVGGELSLLSLAVTAHRLTTEKGR